MVSVRAPAKPQPRRRAPATPVSPAPVLWVPRAVVAVVGAGLGAVIGLSITAESGTQLRAPGGVALFLGSATGLAGTYLALVMVLLVSRVPVVERALGFDGLLRWHRRLAPWPIWLIVAHVLFLVVAYAQAAHQGIWREVGTMLGSFPDVAQATAGFLIVVGVAIVSIRAIRRRIGRERWWAIHLFMYLALALAFAHVIVLGPSFVGHPFTRVVWILLWVATAGSVIAYRFGLPILRSLRHRLEVVEVRPEAPGVASVILTGRRLERLAVSGGQFFEWRFLARGMWWQAHPFSLSARPAPPHLRLTVKSVGDFSSAVHRLRPGTRVAIEGPYGGFTAHARARKKVALIAGGIGVTAVRSLLEDLPVGSEPVVVLRASTREDLALASEVADLVRERRGRVHELVGSRSSINMERLAELVPDIKRRDVYVSGPEEFVHRVVATVRRLGVPEVAIHHEAYALS